MTYYIGLDAHSTTCTFVTMNREGEVVRKVQCPTTEGNLLKFVRFHKGTKKLVFEESNLSKWLYILFKGEVDELVVCNPLYLGKKLGAKTDSLDAWHLANELRCKHLVPVFHEDSEMMDLRVLVGAYSDVVDEIVRGKNRYKALFRSQVLPTKGLAIYKAPERIKELPSQADQFVAEHLFSHIAHLEEAKARYVEKFKRNAKKHKSIKKLCSIPGFDIIRSTIVAALVCSPHRFKNKHKFWAYTMLVKHDLISDGKNYGRKTIWGRKELKCVFDGAATSVLLGNSSLRKYYDRLRAKGLDHKKAKKAVARRIAAICLKILKHGVKYDDKYEEKKKRSEKYTG